MVKKILALFMAGVMFVCCFCLNTSAADLADYSMTDAQWAEYWDENKDNFSQMQLYVGADESELNFCWHSKKSGDIPKVRIGISENMEVYSEFEGTYKNHGDYQANYVTASGFEEDSVYYYSFAVGDGEFSEPEMYRTLKSDSFKALYISDVQAGIDDNGDYATYNATCWNKVLTTALNNNYDISFILNCGDMTNSGESNLEWAATMAPKALRNLPTTATYGNHDRKGDTYKYFVNLPNANKALSTTPDGDEYYFRYGDVLFINLCTTNYNVFDEYNFVEKAVSENPDAKWRVVMFHHDVYGPGHHAGDNDTKLLSAVYSAICDKFDIDVCLTGHEHYYGRSYFMYDDKVVDMDYTQHKAVDPEGTLYFTASSAGGRNRMYDEPFSYEWLCFEYMSEELTYSTIEFDEDTFSLNTYDLEGNVIDYYTIEKTSSDFNEFDTDDGLLNTNAIDRLLRNFTGEYYVIFEALYNVFDIVKSVIASLIS
ncbi:MAG: metallophosphoesterase family protein [Clostridia bacterium]|nr:metallophosphoesterase family protein [Clostridia bacterium]